MWLIWFVIPLAIFLIIGGLLAGGVYTIVFLPIAVIIALGSYAFTLWGRSSGRRRRLPGEDEPARPLPHGHHANTSPAPATPDQLVDAQRRAQ
ncbi:MAG: hypothetical protein ACRDMJ_08445 [Solirubrobacteraceae bacterium]